ncbi:MAG: hypothetical protein J5691_02265 [Bacilli bacterium]|nr:hypothetical protein [Bacilli bacterium]
MSKIKEWFRKRLVTIKRHPNYIALVFMIVAMFYFSLKLETTSNACSTLNQPWMGISLFATMLCSILSVVSFLTAFPRRQKPKYFSIGVALFMLALSIFCDFVIRYLIDYAINVKGVPITDDKLFVYDAYKVCLVHIIMLGASIFMIATLPLYKKLLQKINTSIELDDVKDIEEIKEIDITEE